MAGLDFLAASNTFLNVFSDSPTNLFTIDPADSPKKVHPDYLARALVMNVLPLPGGPYRRMPRGGDRIPSNKSGLFCGMMTASYNIYFKSLIPMISENEFFMSFATSPTTSESTSTFSVFGFSLGTIG